MIAMLGGALAEDAAIRESGVRSLELLRLKLTPDGLIPNNVDAETLRPNFRAYADGGLWWIIGSTILAPDAETVEKILCWYDCQDVDQSGLISMQEGCDWQDLFCTRGKGLYLNALYVLALQAAGRAAEANVVRKRINEFFWYKGDGDTLRHIRHTFSTESVQQQDSLGRRRWLPRKQKLVDEPHYLPYLGFRAIGEWFDSLGHMLAILAGVPDTSQAGVIVDFVRRHELDKPPMKALYPNVQPGDSDWRDYYGMLNLPGRYHNGGVWPFIGAFWVAALTKLGLHEEAGRALERLAALNRVGEFNEWHHGHTGEPMGVGDQAWSAGMYIYAWHCVRERRVPWFTSNPRLLSAS
jgi:hypothetical protein